VEEITKGMDKRRGKKVRVIGKNRYMEYLEVKKRGRKFGIKGD